MTLGTRQRKRLGWFLLIIGALGVVGGIVPFAINGLRLAAGDELQNVIDLARHGVEAMGLSVEWGFLSSAMGTFLGGLLLWAGAGWLRGRVFAPVVTWCYVFGAAAVNVTDMTIFVFKATPGSMRSLMLVLDGIALAIPVILGIWMAAHRIRPCSLSTTGGDTGGF